MSDSGIYMILSPSGKAYVGSSRRLKFRERRHFSDMKNGRHENSALQRAWHKYGANLKFVVVEHCDEMSLIDREQVWLDQVNSNLMGSYNQRSIAGKHGPLDETTKEKLRIAATGFRHSEETKQKMRKPKSASHSAAIGAAKKGMPGKPHNSETKHIRSVQMKEQWADGSRDHISQATAISWQKNKDERCANMRTSWTPERRKKHAENVTSQHLKRHVERLDWIVK